jgi:hypothetical protein
MKKQIIFFQSISLLIMSYVFQTFAGNLSGTISDSAGILISEAKVKLIGKGSTNFSDSTSSNSSGQYGFENVPIGIFNLHVEKSGFFSFDSGFVLGNSQNVINISLNEAPAGIFHTGIVTGVWSPEDNPHRINVDIEIQDSLYIMPGCTVLATHLLYVNNSDLKIGDSNMDKVIFVGGRIVSNKNHSTTIKNADFVQTTFGLVGNKVEIDSCGFDKLPRGEINCVDSLSISNCVFSDCGSSMMFGGRFVELHHNIFGALNAGVGGYNSGSDISLTYNVFGQLGNAENRGSLGIPYQFKGNIKHNNISLFRYNNSIDDLVITDNIIGEVYNASSFLPSDPYSPPFKNNMFSDQVGYLNHEDTHYLGLKQNIQTNANGDSCDLWMNIVANPGFTSDKMFELSPSSKAINAAGDGSNIGCYQGKGVGVIKRTISDDNCMDNFKLEIIQSVKTGNTVIILPRHDLDMDITLYNLIGKPLLNLNNFKGREIRIDQNRYPSGMYLIEIKTPQKNIRQKILLN